MKGKKRYLVILCLSLLSSILLINHAFALTVTEAVEFYCKKYKVDKRIIYAMIKAESSGDIHEVSHKGAAGILQVMPQSGRNYYKHRYEDEKCLWALPLIKYPDYAMRQHMKSIAAAVGAGVWTFRQALDYHDGNTIKALNRYNRGNVPGVSWDYINKVVDEIIRFDNGGSK